MVYAWNKYQHHERHRPKIPLFEDEELRMQILRPQCREEPNPLRLQLLYHAHWKQALPAPPDDHIEAG